jgi:hypothetical protein
MKNITNGLMSAFNEGILVRRVSTSGVTGIVELFKESNNLGIVVELAILVKYNIFDLSSIQRMMLGPSTKPAERGSLHDGVHDAVKGVMTSNQQVACLTREAGVGVLVLSMVGGLASESKVTTEALPRDGGFASRVINS